MTNLNISAKQVEGLLPSVDRRVVEKALALDGRNFTYSLEGPRSAFSSRLASIYALGEPGGFASFFVEGQQFICTNSAIMRLDLVSQVWVPLFSFTTLNTPGPWSMALVGAKYYFARETLGLLQYTPGTLTWAILTSNVPAGARYVAQSNGRLLVLGASSYAWSALDDGADLAPDLTTGAGVQSTAIIGGVPMAMGVYGGGFLVYTTFGVIRASYIGGTAIFRHRPAAQKIKLFNKFSLLTINDDEHIVLTRAQGLLSTDGTEFKTVSPIFNEHILDILDPFDPTRPNAVRLFYDEFNDWLYVSLSYVAGSELFNESLVYVRKLDKWGQFNRAVFGFANLYFEIGGNLGSQFGYVGRDGHFSWFDEVASVEEPIVTAGSQTDLHQEEVFFPTFVMTDGTIVVSSVMICDNSNEAYFATQPVGYYGVAEFTAPHLLLEDGSGSLLLEDGFGQLVFDDFDFSAITATAANRQPLDSQLTIGLFRYTEQQYPGELGLVTTLALGAGFLPVGQEQEDWNVMDALEDWALLSGGEDWGLRIPSAEIFTSQLFSTNDGFAYVQETELTEDLVYANPGKLLYFSVYNVGVWHALRLNALEINQSFHLKFLEMSGNLAGRL